MVLHFRSPDPGDHARSRRSWRLLTIFLFFSMALVYSAAGSRNRVCTWRMRRFKYWKTRTLLILAVIGPGFITANVDNDAGGIYTYSFAGAQFGYSLLWSLIPITLALIVIQEMSARMGAVTGKGLSDLIREEYGFRATFLMMALLVAINFMNVIAEFIGVATSLDLFHVSKYISVPLAAVFVWLLVTKGNYKSEKKFFLSLRAFMSAISSPDFWP